MADIQSAAQWLGRLLVEEAKYLYKVEDKVKELRDELDWMQCFLRDADASQYDNVMARRWVAQIREFAYEAEDTIEKFLIRVVSNTRGRRDILGLLRKYSRILWEARLLHQIGSDIDTLKHKISNLSSKLHTYGIKLRMGESSSSWMPQLREHKTYKIFEEKKLIGRKEVLDTLVAQLVREGKGSMVFSICGVGGVGKTFVAKKIFHHREIRRHFDAFAWAYVSQPCQSSAVQQELLSNLTSKSKEQIAQMTDCEMKHELCKLQRRYKCLIVLDGIWGEEVWGSLKESFPFTCHDYQSKLLITNQVRELAIHVYEDVHIQELQCLKATDSKLLLEEILQGAPDIEISRMNLSAPSCSSLNNEDNSLPGLVDHDTDINLMTEHEAEEKKRITLKVQELKVKMLRYCGGLPLAISVLGGVLATKRTLQEWEDVNKYISSYVISDQEVPQWGRILEMSYYDLPFQLKPSFLYLGYFPTNLEIPTKKIMRLWEAEGLVSSSDDDEMSEDTLEGVAESFLGELVQRSLVQVGSRGITGKAKTCLVHDLMRKLCMDKASQGNWLSIVQLGVDDDQPSGTSSKVPKSSRSAKRRFRRLAIYYSRTSGKLPSDYKHARYIRSLLFFNTLASEEVLIPLKRMVLRKAFIDYKLLRVLDIENIDVQSLPKEVGFLIHLRYLSLRGSCVSKLPSTMKNLKCLQILDLRVLSFVCVRIPDVIWMMERLVHLYLPSKSFILRPEENKVLKLTNLINLETLSNFSNKCKVEDLAQLHNLRKFSSCDFLSNRESINPFLGFPTSELVHLERVSLRLDGKILKEYPQILASCYKLQKLWVKGAVTESLDPGMIPQNLIQLSLNSSRLEIDPMQVLEKLSCLKKLNLEVDSFMGKDMRCSKDGFRELEYLTLKGLKNLEEWTVEPKAMPKLSHLKINGCHKLKMISEGLRYVKNLQELEISYMPFSFFQGQSPQEIKQWVHYEKVEHVPFLKISHVLDLQDVPMTRAININYSTDSPGS